MMDVRGVARLVGLLSLMACSSAAEDSSLGTRDATSRQGSRSNGGAVGVPATSSTPPASGAVEPGGTIETVPVTCAPTFDIVGDGRITRTTRSATGFTGVSTSFAGKVVIQEGAQFHVDIETDSNVQPVITTAVEASGMLVIARTAEVFCSNALRIIVSMPVFRAVESAGPTDFMITKQSASDVDLQSRGSGSIAFSGNALLLHLLVAGSGNILLSNGSATATTIDLVSSGSVLATSFVPGTLTKNILGSGTVSF